MPFTRWITRCAALAAVFALSGCPSLTTVSPPPSADRAASLEQSGDLSGAARVYEALAAQNSGASRNAYLLRAAHDFLSAHRADEAARVLTGLEGTLTPDQQTDRRQLTAEIARAGAGTGRPEGLQPATPGQAENLPHIALLL